MSKQPEGLDILGGLSGEPSIKYSQVIERPTNPKKSKGGKLKRHLKEVVRPTWNFAGRLKSQQDHEINALVGLASEAGEALDIGKKKWYHSEKPDGFFREALVKELGDILYYFLKTLDVFGISLDEVLKLNREKLESRHPELSKVETRFNGSHIR